MSDCKRINKEENPFVLEFQAEFDFSVEKPEEIRAVINFLRNASENKGLERCYSWATRLADIIENKNE